MRGELSGAQWSLELCMVQSEEDVARSPFRKKAPETLTCGTCNSPVHKDHGKSKGSPPIRLELPFLRRENVGSWQWYRGWIGWLSKVPKRRGDPQSPLRLRCYSGGLGFRVCAWKS